MCKTKWTADNVPSQQGRTAVITGGLLLDRMLPVAGSRVLTISSTGHRTFGARIHFRRPAVGA
jgi:hypothetical protein